MALEYKMKQGKSNRVFPRECTEKTPSSNNTRDSSTHGYHQMVNTKIRLIISFAVKMEKLYTVSKNKTRS